LEIEKSNNFYTVYKTNIDQILLSEIYNNFAGKMRELDLNKQFKINNYEYSANPMWVELQIDDHPYLNFLLNNFGLDGIDTKISLSKLPAGKELKDHKDIGRRSVLLVPISGVDSSLYINDENVAYHNNVLLMDTTTLHGVKKSTVDRITLQFAFRKNYSTIAKITKKKIKS
tara:strand:+ start:733 stop:1248 length:516 start_codon:yes stop_codon:yes gene_type:complete